MRDPQQREILKEEEEGAIGCELRADCKPRLDAIFIDCDYWPQEVGGCQEQRDIAQLNSTWRRRRTISNRLMLDPLSLAHKKQSETRIRPVVLEEEELGANSKQYCNVKRRPMTFIKRSNQSRGTMFGLKNFTYRHLRSNNVALLIVSALMVTTSLLVGSSQAASNGALQSANFRLKRQSGPGGSPQAEAAGAAAAATTTSAPARSKIPAVNFTLVDELFNSVMEESEVGAKWRHMDKTLTDGVRSILKIVFPHIVSMATDAKVSGNCSGAILKWILNLRNLRSWAVQMLDSIGKPGAGILRGSLTMFGNYKQCMAVRAPDEDEIEIVEEFREYFRGQYCVLQLRPFVPPKPQFYSLNSTIESLKRKSYKYYEKNVYDDLAELGMAFNFVNIRADLCVPSLCSRDDIQRVADFIAKKVDMRARVARCDIQPLEEHSGVLQLASESQLVWSSVFLVLILLVIISTVASLVLRLEQKRAKSRAHSLITSMSLTRSLSHIKNVHLDRINDSKPVLLYALRLLILLWICLVSLTSQLDFQYLRELLSLRDLIMHWPMQLIVNSSLQFDTLILLTAFTYSYQNVNSNFKDLIKYNVGKYSRLMPSIMLLVAITIITPLFYMDKSPVWHDFVDQPAQVCQSTGFMNLFFLQNFLNQDQMCLPQTWLFCVEFQLCILALPIVYLLNNSFDQNHGRFRLRSLPVLTLILAALIGCLINFTNVYQNSLPAAWFLTYPDKEDKNVYLSKHLYKTWTHLTTFAVGLLSGHLCRCQSIATFSGRPYGRKCCDGLMWTSSLITMLMLLFSLHSWTLSGTSHLDHRLASAFYAALAPLLWAISWSLILFQMIVPNEKCQRSSLCHLLAADVNIVRLGRLTFLAYLLNPYVNNFVLAIQEQAVFSSLLILGHTFIGNLVLTFVGAFLISAIIELPCRRLIKKLALGSRRQCTNLGIITRQLDIRQQNQGPSHDSFTNSSQNKNQLSRHNQSAVNSTPMVQMK